MKDFTEGFFLKEAKISFYSAMQFSIGEAYEEPHIN